MELFAIVEEGLITPFVIAFGARDCQIGGVESPTFAVWNNMFHGNSLWREGIFTVATDHSIAFDDMISDSFLSFTF
jgi:hypothetical protein